MNVVLQMATRREEAIETPNLSGTQEETASSLFEPDVLWIKLSESESEE